MHTGSDITARGGDKMFMHLITMCNQFNGSKIVAEFGWHSNYSSSIFLGNLECASTATKNIDPWNQRRTLNPWKDQQQELD